MEQAAGAAGISLSPLSPVERAVLLGAYDENAETRANLLGAAFSGVADCDGSRQAIDDVVAKQSGRSNR